MVSRNILRFVTELSDELLLAQNETDSFRISNTECVRHCEDVEAKLRAAQDNLFSVQRKLYAAVTLINDVYKDYRDLNFKTKAGRKRADQMLEQMRRFQQEYDIHIENTERGWVAK